MMRKIAIALAILILLMLGSPTAVHAASGKVELILHKRVLPAAKQETGQYPNSGEQLAGNSPLLSKTEGLNGVRFKIYDATPLRTAAAGQGATADEFTSTYTNMEIGAAQQLIDQQGLHYVTTITTGHDAQLREDGVARVQLPSVSHGAPTAFYLIEDWQDTSTVNLVAAQFKPLMLALNIRGADGTVLDPIHFYPKNEIYARDPYFFKFGRNDDKEWRLAGASFVLARRTPAGELLYLADKQPSTTQLRWQLSTDPAGDRSIRRFTSDASGLVATPNVLLPGGDYQFQEVEAPTGYTRRPTPVPVHIPRTWQEAVTVDHQKIVEYPTSVFPDHEIKLARVRVYNEKIGSSSPGSSNSSPNSHQQAQHGWLDFLPQLGNRRSLITIGLGLILMVCAGIVWRSRKRDRRH